MGLAVFTLLPGIAFVITGRKARRLWLIIWGAMLAMVSVACAAAIHSGYG